MISVNSLHKFLLAAITAGVSIYSLAADFTMFSTADASRHYTDSHMTALANRIGKIFWIQDIDGRIPIFSTEPAATSSTFPAPAGDSFEIVDLVGRKNKSPYYKVRFVSGKDGYLRPEIFHEELNLTILSTDPLADEKRRAAAQAEEQRKRTQWINAQAWSPTVKAAALNGQVIPGMNRDEVKKIAGAPSRVSKVQLPGTSPAEHWYYPDGKELIFQYGLLSQTITKDSKNPKVEETGSKLRKKLN